MYPVGNCTYILRTLDVPEVRTEDVHIWFGLLIQKTYITVPRLYVHSKTSWGHSNTDVHKTSFFGHT